MNPTKLSLVSFVILVGTVGALYAEHSLIARTTVGLVLQGLAIALMVWARVTFGMRSFHAAANPTAGGLVCSGPYKFWRHPIYAAVLLLVWAGVLSQGMMPKVIAVVLAILATAMTVVRIVSEEVLLRASMPEYAAYAQRTKRLVPFVF
ncbi:MAG: isoprenylcysteine carboxylmethyltransferase family protein [Gemmatimonadaceae bacterium]